MQRAGGGEDVMRVGNSGRSTLAEVPKGWGVVGGQVPKTCIKGSDWGAPSRGALVALVGLGEGTGPLRKRLPRQGLGRAVLFFESNSAQPTSTERSL